MNTSRHVCLVSTYYYPELRGGTEHTLQNLAEALVRQGLRVSVLALQAGPRPERYSHNGVSCHALPVPNLRQCLIPQRRPHRLVRALWHALDVYNPRAGHLLETELRRIRPDLIQFHNLPGWSAAVWSAARRFGRPYLQVLHDYQLTCPAATRFRAGRNCTGTCLGCRPYAILRRRLSQDVAHVVANSRYTRDIHRREGFFPVARSFDVIHGAVPPAKADESVAFRPPDARIRLGYIGRLHQTKGVELLIASLKRVNRGDLTLRLAGSGIDVYERSLRDMAVGVPTEFLGHVPASKFLRSIDILVVPSLWNEPMGRVVIEAAAHGVPVIAARRGGLPELVQEGTTGWLFEPDRPETLDALLRGVERAQLKDAAPACVRWGAEFHPDRIAAQWLRLYSHVTDTPAAMRQPTLS